MYGVTGTVTNEVRTAVQTIQRNSRVRIIIHESSGSPRGAVTTTEDAGSDLFAIKDRADKFYDDAGRGVHNYIRL